MYKLIFMPCWECFDFRATMAHEAGHLLGFEHPDKYDQLNLRALAPMGPSTCVNSLTPRHIELQPLAADADTELPQ